MEKLVFLFILISGSSLGQSKKNNFLEKIEILDGKYNKCTQDSLNIDFWECRSIVNKEIHNVYVEQYEYQEKRMVRLAINNDNDLNEIIKKRNSFLNSYNKLLNLSDFSDKQIQLQILSEYKNTYENGNTSDVTFDDKKAVSEFIDRLDTILLMFAIRAQAKLLMNFGY